MEQRIIDELTRRWPAGDRVWYVAYLKEIITAALAAAKAGENVHHRWGFRGIEIKRAAIGLGMVVAPWLCTACLFDNPAGALRCERCGGHPLGPN